jgi:hypothetical protein
MEDDDEDDLLSFALSPPTALAAQAAEARGTAEEVVVPGAQAAQAGPRAAGAAGARPVGTRRMRRASAGDIEGLWPQQQMAELPPSVLAAVWRCMGQPGELQGQPAAATQEEGASGAAQAEHGSALRSAAAGVVQAPPPLQLARSTSSKVAALVAVFDPISAGVSNASEAGSQQLPTSPGAVPAAGPAPLPSLPPVSEHSFASSASLAAPGSVTAAPAATSSDLASPAAPGSDLAGYTVRSISPNGIPETGLSPQPVPAQHNLGAQAPAAAAVAQQQSARAARQLAAQAAAQRVHRPSLEISVASASTVGTGTGMPGSRSTEFNAIYNSLQRPSMHSMASHHTGVTGVTGITADTTGTSSTVRVRRARPPPRYTDNVGSIISIMTNTTTTSSVMVEPQQPDSIYQHSMMTQPSFEQRKTPPSNWVFNIINVVMLLALVAAAVLDARVAVRKTDL